jgi:hypothetical protein
VVGFGDFLLFFIENRLIFACITYCVMLVMVPPSIARSVFFRPSFSCEGPKENLFGTETFLFVDRVGMRLSHYGRRQGNKMGPSGKWAGAFDVSDERETSFGCPRCLNYSQAGLIWPSAQTIFLSAHFRAPIFSEYPHINQME